MAAPLLHQRIVPYKVLKMFSVPSSATRVGSKQNKNMDVFNNLKKTSYSFVNKLEDMAHELEYTYSNGAAELIFVTRFDKVK